MAISNIAMEPRTIVDTQYTVHATYDAANDAANKRAHGTSIVLTQTKPSRNGGGLGHAGN
jgi:hypothetical protein